MLERNVIKMEDPDVTAMKANKDNRDYVLQAVKEKGKFGALKTFFNRKYKEIKAINNISFSIKKGEIVGYIGPNGAGKSTLMNILCGLYQPTSGEIYLEGKKVKISAKLGANGKLFGSVTSKEIAEAVNSQLKIAVDKKKVSLKSDIKGHGTYSAEIKLYTGISAKITVEVGE